MAYTAVVLAALVGCTLSVSLHHEPGHVRVHQVVPPQVVAPHVVIMQHMQQVLHHHVEPVLYVHPVNTRAFTTLQANTAASASCTLSPSAPEGLVRGLITLHQLHPGAPVLVSGQIDGLSPGLHGFHLHRDGNTANMCKAAGPHFNPTNATHGSPNDMTRHAGDFGNIEADEEGRAVVSFSARGISLDQATNDSVLGRAFVVHAREDDLGRGRDAESLKTGNAGARVACCVVTPHH